MKKYIFSILMVLVSTYAFSKPDDVSKKTYDQILDVLSKQELRKSDTGSVIVNGRDTALQPKDFSQVIINSINVCNDLGVYSNKKATSNQCKKNILDGFKHWVKLAADKNISKDAWYAGARASVFGEPNPDNMTIAFAHWVGISRVAQTKIPERDRVNNWNRIVRAISNRENDIRNYYSTQDGTLLYADKIEKAREEIEELKIELEKYRK